MDTALVGVIVVIEAGCPDVEDHIAACYLSFECVSSCNKVRIAKPDLYAGAGLFDCGGVASCFVFVRNKRTRRWDRNGDPVVSRYGCRSKSWPDLQIQRLIFRSGERSRLIDITLFTCTHGDRSRHTEHLVSASLRRDHMIGTANDCYSHVRDIKGSGLPDDAADDECPHRLDHHPQSGRARLEP